MVSTGVGLVVIGVGIGGGLAFGLSRLGDGLGNGLRDGLRGFGKETFDRDYMQRRREHQEVMTALREVREAQQLLSKNEVLTSGNDLHNKNQRR
jgi:hypothetical protein